MGYCDSLTDRFFNFTALFFGSFDYFQILSSKSFRCSKSFPHLSQTAFRRASYSPDVLLSLQQKKLPEKLINQNKMSAEDQEQTKQTSSGSLSSVLSQMQKIIAEFKDGTPDYIDKDLKDKFSPNHPNS